LRRWLRRTTSRWRRIALGPIALHDLQIAFAVPASSSGAGVGIPQRGQRLLDYLLDPSLRFVDGYAALPTAPGLSITIDERAVGRAAATVTGGATDLARPDGSFREW
jgi:galactonate dehydratase